MHAPNLRSTRIYLNADLQFLERRQTAEDAGWHGCQPITRKMPGVDRDEQSDEGTSVEQQIRCMDAYTPIVLEEEQE